MPDITSNPAEMRDEVGLIRAIAVKVCSLSSLSVHNVLNGYRWLKERSSSQRKELFQTIQTKAGTKAKQLILDMPIRWSLTYIMLDRAESLKDVHHQFVSHLFASCSHLQQHVDSFVFKIAREEKDAAKREKLNGLLLTPDEWSRAHKFLHLLAVCFICFICSF